MPKQLSDELCAKAEREGITMSQLFERAIRKQIPPDNLPAHERPDWEEITAIDFTGFLDRDCNERVIYKSADGLLKAVHRDAPEGPEVVEDVTFEQCAEWLLQTRIPDEFLSVFRPRLCRDAEFKARNALEDTVYASAALIEAVASMMSSEEMTDKAIDGMKVLAQRQGDALRTSLSRYLDYTFTGAITRKESPAP